MCGILGTVHFTKCLDLDLFKKQLDCLIHRGPDSQGIWTNEDKTIAFGHNRLAIIDLSNNGNQPMESYNKRYIVVFNGEIYNFQDLKNDLKKLGYNFRSNSDTEVLLNAYDQWGVSCLEHLVGMFAFAIYDKVSNIIFIARDRAGEKPLYYSLTNNFFTFASELKALLKAPYCPKKINKNSLKSYFYFNYVQGDSSIIEGINKLLPGYFALIDLNNKSIKLQKHWEIPSYEGSHLPMEKLLSKFDILIRNSIKQQLVADVPLGILLSGGLDSSIITAIASEYKKNINTFTIRFKGHGKLDESSHAKLIAKHFQTNHFELDASTVEPEILYDLVYNCDEPISDPAIIPTYILSKLVRKYCKVVLGGEGADEIFGGYTHYQRFLKLKDKLKYFPLILRKRISNIAESVFPLGTRGLASASLLRYDFDKEAPVYSQFNMKGLNRLLPGYFKTNNDKCLNSLQIADEIDLINRLTKTDFCNYLADDILVKVDRTSMANSLEMRAPFLNKNIIEFAFHELPPKYKVTLSNKKIFLKEFGKKLLPHEFDFNRKQGFEVPFEAWYKEKKWRDFFNEVLLDSNSIFNNKEITKLIAPTRLPVLRSNLLFSLVVFELWKRKYWVNL